MSKCNWVMVAAFCILFAFPVVAHATGPTPTPAPTVGCTGCDTPPLAGVVYTAHDLLNRMAPYEVSYEPIINLGDVNTQVLYTVLDGYAIGNTLKGVLEHNGVMWIIAGVLLLKAIILFCKRVIQTMKQTVEWGLKELQQIVKNTRSQGGGLGGGKGW